MQKLSKIFENISLASALSIDDGGVANSFVFGCGETTCGTNGLGTTGSGTTDSLSEIGSSALGDFFGNFQRNLRQNCFLMGKNMENFPVRMHPKQFLFFVYDIYFLKFENFLFF